jgi:hypothetical protein
MEIDAHECITGTIRSIINRRCEAVEKVPSVVFARSFSDDAI